MDILNMNEFAIHPRIVSPTGEIDTVHVMAKRRATLPQGYSVDANWLASTARVSVYSDKRSRVPLSVGTGSEAGVAVVAARAQPQVVNSGIGAAALAARRNQQVALAEAQAKARAQAETNTEQQAPEPGDSPDSESN